MHLPHKHMNIKTIQAWVSAFRLRTLPLSLSVVATGSALAAQEGHLSIPTLGLCLLTTLFLQILSNLSNDYGDTVHGADGSDRLGPTRAVQSGAISLRQMRRAMFVFALLSLASGIVLLVEASGTIGVEATSALLAIGLMCIAAAIAYTNGRHPYGYHGLGDVSVFLFFGLVGVGGCYFLHTGHLAWPIALPASAVGLLSVGVLNMNNIRDMESDRAAGKKTVPLLVGRHGAKVYQAVIVVTAVALLSAYVALFGSRTQWICSLAAVPLLSNAVGSLRHDDAAYFDSQLRLVSLSTFALSLLFLGACAAAQKVDINI